MKLTTQMQAEIDITQRRVEQLALKWKMKIGFGKILNDENRKQDSRLPRAEIRQNDHREASDQAIAMRDQAPKLNRATEKRNRISFDIGGNMTTIIEELKTHKVRVENILCETDVKEQGHSSYTRTSSGFLERFYELALRKNNCLLSNCFSILVKPLMTVKQ